MPAAFGVVVTGNELTREKLATASVLLNRPLFREPTLSTRPSPGSTCSFSPFPRPSPLPLARNRWLTSVTRLKVAPWSVERITAVVPLLIIPCPDYRTEPLSQRMQGSGFTALAAQVHGMGLRFGVHIMRGVPRQAVGQNPPVAGSRWRCDEVADFGLTCRWNNDMVGVNPDHHGAFDWYRSWISRRTRPGMPNCQAGCRM